MVNAEARNHARAFLKKAEEYLASAEDNLAVDRNTPAAGDAIHAGISAKDAAVPVDNGWRSARSGLSSTDEQEDHELPGPVLEVSARKGTRGTAYRVRWWVDGQIRSETFATASLADSFRAGLVSAARNGEAFDIESGLPASRVTQTCAGSGSRWLASSSTQGGMSSRHGTARAPSTDS